MGAAAVDVAEMATQRREWKDTSPRRGWGTAAEAFLRLDIVRAMPQCLLPSLLGPERPGRNGACAVECWRVGGER